MNTLSFNDKYHIRILSPREFSGSVHGDYGYEINGVKSSNGYISRKSAYNAMWRRIEKLEVESKAIN